MRALLPKFAAALGAECPRCRATVQQEHKWQLSPLAKTAMEASWKSTFSLHFPSFSPTATWHVEACTCVRILLYLWPFVQQFAPWNRMSQTITVDIQTVIGPVGQILATRDHHWIYECATLLHLKFSISCFSRSHIVSNSTSIGSIFLQPDLSLLETKL